MLGAIVVVEEYKCLREGGIVGRQADGGPPAEDGIGLGRELFEERESLSLAMFVGVLTAIFEEKGDPSVDDERMY